MSAADSVPPGGPSADDAAPAGAPAEPAAPPCPPDTCPPDTCPPDTCPPDTCPPDTCPPDTCPPDTCPPDTCPPDACPPEALPPGDGAPAVPAAAGAQPASGFVRGLVRASVELLETLRTDRRTWFAAGLGAVALTVSRYHFTTGEYRRLAEGAPPGGLFARWAEALPGGATLAPAVAHATGPVAEYVWWFLGALLIYLALPLGLARAVGGVRPRDLGVGVGDWRFGLKATGLLYAVMLPFVVGAALTPAFARHYPLAAGATSSGAALLVFELCYIAYFAGWEFVYRGLLCVGLYEKLGAAVILLQTIPFAVMHAGKPEAEAYGSIIAGLALGALAVRTRSFWYGALLHALVAVTMDVAALTVTGRWPRAW